MERIPHQEDLPLSPRARLEDSGHASPPGEAARAAAAPLVWINGFPGSGKLTMATALATLHGAATLLDNHKLIDPVEARFPRTHPDYQRERQLYRKTVLDEFVADKATLSRLVIFTDFQSSNELGRQVATEYRDAARSAGRPFVPVYLTCDVDENLKRVAYVDRVNSQTGKLTDIQVLRGIRSTCELFRFADHPHLTVDSTSMAPLELANKVLAFLENKNGTEDWETLDTTRRLLLERQSQYLGGELREPGEVIPNALATT